jgi:hypothetical protein
MEIENETITKLFCYAYMLIRLILIILVIVEVPKVIARSL